MLPEAFITHFSSGRVRVKVPSRKGDQAYFLSLKEKFSAFPGVQRTEVNALTGSILILHSLNLESLDLKQMAAYTEFNGLFRLGGDPLSERGPTLNIRGRFKEMFQNLNEKMTGMTQGEIDLPTLAFLSLLGIGIYQISIGNFAAPAWYVAFWYAMNIFLQAETRNGT